MLGVVSLVVAAALGEPHAAALIIGVNRSVDESLPPLQFADDDALAYAAVFESVGIPSHILTRLDADTAAIYGDGRPRVHDPTAASLLTVRAELRAWAANHPDNTLFVVYAGHGNVQGGSGYITLEDARLTGGELRRELIDVIDPTRVHLIVDACYSVFLAYHRGPGGERRAVRGFSEVDALLDDPRVGLLLSTSATNQSHEWARFGGGVFSHLVRSGLYGAADANRDDRIDYKELAAFVSRATASIDNPRYRPSIFAKPPRDSDTLLPLGEHSQRLELASLPTGRYLVEDGRGIRYLDFNLGDNPTAIHLPPTHAALYVRRWDADGEWLVDRNAGSLSPGTGTPGNAGTRGAVHEAFDKILTLGFGPQVVFEYAYPSLPAWDETTVTAMPVPTWRRNAGWTALAVTVAAFGGGIGLSADAMGLRKDVTPTTSHAQIATLNRRIDDRNLQALVLYGAGGAAALTGLLLLLWPESPPSTGLDDVGGLR